MEKVIPWMVVPARHLTSQYQRSKIWFQAQKPALHAWKDGMAEYHTGSVNRHLGRSKDYEPGVGKDGHHDLGVGGAGMECVGQDGLLGVWVRVGFEQFVIATHEDHRHEQLVLLQVSGSRQGQMLVRARYQSWKLLQELKAPVF